MKSSEIKTLLLDALAQEADGKLAEIGFNRTQRSLEFTRKLPDAIQVLKIDLAVRPSYMRDALAHVYPRARLSMPSVCQKAADLVSGNTVLLSNAPHVMFNRPFEHLVPKIDRAQWYAFEQKDFIQIVRDVVAAFFKWGFPFFECYRTAQDVIMGYEARDERLIWQENWPVFVAAAMLTLGNACGASELLDSAFGSPGLRKTYAVVFSNIESMLHSDNSD